MFGMKTKKRQMRIVPEEAIGFVVVVTKVPNETASVYTLRSHDGESLTVRHLPESLRNLDALRRTQFRMLLGNTIASKNHQIAPRLTFRLPNPGLVTLTPTRTSTDAASGSASGAAH